MYELIIVHKFSLKTVYVKTPWEAWQTQEELVRELVSQEHFKFEHLAAMSANLVKQSENAMWLKEEMKAGRTPWID
jgi:hypothetical protein